MDGSQFPNRFTLWLNNTMESRRYSQAELARAVGVGDAQVSRWRRGQVVPTVRSLQRIADTFGVPRVMLDSLAGYPTDEVEEGLEGDAGDLARRTEIRAYQAWFGQQLERQVPRELWRVYADGCAALAEALGGSFRATLIRAEQEVEEVVPEDDAEKPPREIGFPVLSHLATWWRGGAMDTTATGQPRRERLPILALLCATATSLLGSQLTLIAIPWFVLQTTGSAARTGFTGFFSLLPLLIGGVFGGLLVDRLGFRRASIVADLGSGLLVALVPLLHHTIGLAYWQLLVLVFLRSLIGTPGNTARQGLTPDLIALSGFGRERMNAAFQGTLNLATLLGAPLAGLLIVALGPSNVLWLDAGSYLISALIVAFAVPRSRATTDTHPAEQQNVGLRAGFRFVGRDRVLLALVLTGTAINFFGAPFGGVVLPFYAERVLGSPVALGLIFAGTGVGGLVGTVLFGAISHRLPRRALFVGAFLVSAVPLWGLTPLPPFLPVAAAMILNSLVLAPLSPLLMTILQERVPTELRGRVFGMLTALILAAAPLGLLIAGIALDALGLRVTLLVMACAYTAIVVGTAFNPALRRLDTSRSAPDDDQWRSGAVGAEPA